MDTTTKEEGPMIPIGIGIIGLSGTPPEAKDGISWAEKAHLPYLKATPVYEIRALLNSSVGSAEAAIVRHDLPPHTKTYSDPKLFAADNKIELVVCCVRVDKHFQTVGPSIRAGKRVYVEWPLERNLETAKEMEALAEAHNVRTIVGLQSSFSPVLRKMKQLLESGVVGRPLSSIIVASLEQGGPTESQHTRFFLDRHVGANIMSVHGGHAIEYVTYVLGDLKKFKSSCTMYSVVKDIVDAKADNRVLRKAVENTVPNHMLLYGTATSSDAAVVMNLSGGPGIPGVPNLDWRVQGESGWLRLTSTSMALNVGTLDTKLEIYRATDGSVEEVLIEGDEWSRLPIAAQNIARLYEAVRNGQWYPDFSYAVKRHEYIEAMWRSFGNNSNLSKIM